MNELLIAVFALNGHIASLNKQPVLDEDYPEYHEEFYEEIADYPEFFTELNHSKCYSKSHSKCDGYSKSHDKTACG